jgi:ABC-type bacteriocin/lantibiotic exporter with double-glycine peptidase domain
MSAPNAPAPLRRLLALLRTERNDLYVAAVFSLAAGALSLAVPIASQALVNTVAFGNLLQPLAVLSLIVLALLAVSSLLQVMRFHVVEVLQRRIFVRLASESVHRLLHARIGALRMLNGPEVVNRFLDIVTVQKASATLLVDGLSVFTQTAAGMVLLAIYHPWLLAFDAVLLAAVLIVVFPAGVGAVGSAIRESKAKYALVGWLEEIARNSTTFRGRQAAEFARQRCDSLVRDYLDSRSRHFRVLLRQFSGSLLLQALGSAALLGIGGMLVVERQLTLGQLVAAELVVTAVLAGVSKLAKHLETFYDLLAALDKLGTISDIPSEPSGSEAPLEDAPAGVLVRSGAFSLAVAPRERVAIQGPSGAGKSTLLDAVCGYRELPGVSVSIDGLDLRSLRLEDLRTHTALVRDVEIFHGSILDNVRTGRDISLAAVQQAMEQTGLWSAVHEMPGGLDTILATGGDPLSAGQKQALVIARAIAGRPRLLIIDEALDRVQDAAAREQLAGALFDSAAPWTLLLVTAREDLLARCGRVIRWSRSTQPEAA